MTSTIRAALLIVCGWLAVFASVMIFRPLMPVIETRYMSVAWEMLIQHHWLLPTLNFEAYAQKPPMLFWIIRTGWEIFGIGVLGPRVLIFLGVGFLFYATARLARDLWPESPVLSARAALLLAALPLVLVYGSTIMFDCLLALCVVAGMIAIWRASQDDARAWVFFGIAIGFGVLIKGPVMLVQVLPAALLGPVWHTRATWKHWYKGIAFAVLIGAAMGLAWAVPAALQGGADYTHKIFVTQSAGRMVQAFDHVEPFWYYIPVLAAFLLPFLAWPALWHKTNTTPQTRFLACWILPVILFFSIISSKSAHYLLPVMPALAILVVAHAREDKWRLAVIPVLISALPSIVMLVAPALAQRYLFVYHSWLAVLHVVLCAGLAILIWRKPRVAFHGLAAASFMLVVVAHIQAGAGFFPRYDLSGLKDALKPYAERPLAVLPGYDGEYGYVLGLHGPVKKLHPEQLGRMQITDEETVTIARVHQDFVPQYSSVLYRRNFRHGEEILILESSHVCKRDDAPYFVHY